MIIINIISLKIDKFIILTDVVTLMAIQQHLEITLFKTNTPITVACTPKACLVIIAY